MSEAIIRLCGDCAVTVEFKNEISIETNKKVVALKYGMELQKQDGIKELVPSYRSLLIHYDPARISYDRLASFVFQCVEQQSTLVIPAPVVTEIPVLYEGEDIEEIARLEHKTVDEIVRIHSQSDYFVYMLGFAPGHPYTARQEHPFSCKRRDNPRVKIAGGSIVVQLGLSDIIPFDQPCGWNIIGMTPIKVCDYNKKDPFLLQAGQWIRHIPIDQTQYDQIRQQAEAGSYICKTYEKEA